MTQYRRKVSDEQVVEVKKRFDKTDILSVFICPSVVRGVLEADAEVIEAQEKVEGFMYYEMTHPSLGNANIMGITIPLKQFQQEWEEVK